MTGPTDPQRLASNTSMVERFRTIDRALASLDARVASSGRAGIVVNYAGPALPAGLLPADGSVVAQATYPRLFAAILTTHNTGGEGAGNFRLPNYTIPPQHGVWAITT
jgi:hypothetical protein